MNIIYTINAYVMKLSPDSQDADKEGYVIHIPRLKVNIQSMQPEYTAIGPNGETAKMYRGYTTAKNISESMMLVASGNTTYSGSRFRITGVEEWNGPLGLHYNLILVEAPKA